MNRTHELLHITFRVEYREGSSAKHYGKNILKNPYVPNSEKWHLWNRGYKETYNTDAHGWHKINKVETILPEPKQKCEVWIVPGLDYYPDTPLSTGWLALATFDGKRWNYSDSNEVCKTGEGNRVTHWKYASPPPCFDENF